MRDTRGTRLLLSIALIAALVLIAVSYSNGSSSTIRTARNMAGTVLGSAERAVSTVTRPVGRFFDSGLAGGSDARVTSLQAQIIRMRAQLNADRLSKGQYRQLQGLLAEAGQGGYRILAATVIGYGQGFQQSVTLNVGSANGIRPQMTVMDGGGLVGQIVSVSARTCTVLLATDASSVVGVRLAPGGQIGWVTGEGPARSGAALFKLQVLDPGALHPGEQLVTAASVRDRPFVPGVPVGRIVSVRNRAGALTGQAVVRPYVNFSSLDVVGVVVAPPRHNPLYSVLPPKPKPTPSPSPSSSGRLVHGKSGGGSRPSPSGSPSPGHG
jgi:rod shape-determining protein MreC